MDVGVWQGAFVQAELDEEGRGRLWLDLHARRDGGRMVGIVRPGLGWTLAPGLVAWAGYAWVPWSEDERSLVSEHRAWEQLLWTTELGPLDGALRPRLEQRFGQGSVGLRARLFTRAQLPVRGPVALVVWDEPFVGLTSSALGPAGFDQNRLFVGPALRWDDARFELGYLDQRLLRDGEWSAVGIVAANVFLTL